MTQPDPITDRLPMPPAEFLAAVTMVGERAAAGYGWQEGYLAGRAAAAADIRARIAAVNSEPDTATHTLPEHLLGDGPCTGCGTNDNIVWFTDSVFWNAVVRQSDYIEPILCIPCFVKRADAAGYWPTGWRLTPEFHWETHEEHAARKERQPDPGPAPVWCRPCLSFYAAGDIEAHSRTKHPWLTATEDAS